jgi:prepilin-type N-terminal cleavage/methylation domain-containing protein
MAAGLTAKVAMKTPSHRRRAFTLLEIMVALALLSVIIIAIYSSWKAILKGTAVAREVAAASQRSRITMRTLEDSLLCACMFNANPGYYTFEANGDDTDYSSFSFVARLPKSFPRSGKFGDLDVRRLSFTIEPDKESGKNLRTGKPARAGKERPEIHHRVH